MPESDTVDEDLRDPDAFARFYRTHLAAVYGYLLRLAGGDRALAEDLTQDAWLQLAQAVRDGRTASADVRWLITVGRNRFIDHARRESTSRRKLMLVASSERGSPAPDEPPSRAEVLVGLQQLEPHHRLVLMMRYIDGEPVPAIAASIGRSLGATNSLLARARAELRGTSERRSNGGDRGE